VPIAAQSLETVAAVVRGVSFEKSQVRTEPRDGTVPILRAGNIKDVLDTNSDLVWVPSECVKPEQRLRSGDIAICMSSGSQAVVGKSAPIQGEWYGSVGAFCAIVRPRPEVIDPAYLALYMRSERFRSWTRTSEGINIKNIRLSELLKHRVPVPPVVEQRRVVDLLSRAGNIVRMREEAEQKAKKIIPALFMEMFGDPATNPKSWEVTTLGEIIANGPQNGLYQHADTYGSGTPILRIDGFYDGQVIPVSAWRRLRLELTEERRFGLTEGDIVINRVNSPEYLGKSAIIPHLSEAAVYESNMMRLGVRRDRVMPEFVIQFLQTTFARSALIKNAKHAINQSSINQGDVKGISVYVPPLATQAVFRSRAAEARSLEIMQDRATTRAKTSFQSLLAGVFGDRP
jgi:type I restriction enzyme S subunit